MRTAADAIHAALLGSTWLGSDSAIVPLNANVAWHLLEHETRLLLRLTSAGIIFGHGEPSPLRLSKCFC